MLEEKVYTVIFDTKDMELAFGLAKEHKGIIRDEDGDMVIDFTNVYDPEKELDNSEKETYLVIDEMCCEQFVFDNLEEARRKAYLIQGVLYKENGNNRTFVFDYGE